MKNAYLAGERVYLRPVELSDAPAIVEWLNDEEVLAYLGLVFPINAIREEEWIKKMYEDQKNLVFAIVLKENDRYVGNCGLHQIDWVNRFGVFGIAIGVKSEWSKGYGQEAARLILRLAFEKLNLNKVELQVFEYNERGIRCYERVGYRLEGRLRARKWRQNRYWDVLQYGLLREEWLAAQHEKLAQCQAGGP